MSGRERFPCLTEQPAAPASPGTAAAHKAFRDHGYRTLHENLRDQGSQVATLDWKVFIRAHALEHAMSRRGNCHDNAGAESFSSSLKRYRVRHRA
ncbi:DDE-type integrase/transposase/recombinase [Novosphingobium profundi]|nr:DDE-type integrase/transposase/recombinase [Novosphingobium profundi]